MFTRSLKSGQVPQDWRLANVTPIFKKGSKNLASNYRPISLTSQVCKTMEKLIKGRITEHLNANHLAEDRAKRFEQVDLTIEANAGLRSWRILSKPK